MTKKGIIRDGVMENATLSHVGKTKILVSAKSFVVTQDIQFGKLQYTFYSCGTNLASLTLLRPCEANMWILYIDKDARWNNATKRDVNIAIEAILEKFGCSAKVVIYIKNGEVGALCDIHHNIKIEIW